MKNKSQTFHIKPPYSSQCADPAERRGSSIIGYLGITISGETKKTTVTAPQYRFISFAPSAVIPIIKNIPATTQRGKLFGLFSKKSPHFITSRLIRFLLFRFK